MLGVLKSGAAYLPLDPAFPKERLSGLLADAGALTVLSGGKAAGRLEGLAIPLLSLDDLDGLGDTGESGASGVGDVDDGDRLAYVIYTSGSTGKPKGVMITHRALANYLSWCTGAYHLEEGNGVLLHSSPAYDFTVTTLLAPLAAGGKIVIPPPSPAGVDPEFLEREAEGLTLVKLTPSHARALGRILSPEARRRLTRTLVLGRRGARGVSSFGLGRPGGAARIFNEYGPTEATVGCCVHQVSALESGSAAVPIGRPIANTKLFILDQFFRPAPVGLPGELCIGGAGLARGYLGRPDLTAERFVPDCWSGEPGARIYRSGDLARRLADGTVEFLGRLDDQVKVRGHRVELAEIEAALGQCPGVLEAAVVSFPDASGESRLAAFLAADKARPVSGSEAAALPALPAP